ncbi:MAG: FAD binding domain-containing protein, partial [Xanthomonadales bacterium]|nr:FAD binding domain-containing protein [Xanthomonadales bacterium]
MHTLRFLLNQDLQEITDIDPTLTVLRWLRECADLHGTKEGCAEGDCGACTVVLGRPTADNRMQYKAVNACILFMPALDGCQLLTVEHLKSADGSLHPVQQAMVDQHASQCGFCTPGFVMSLFALHLQGGQPTRELVCESLAGNLCRCTGYRPIVDAALSMHDASWREPVLDDAPQTLARLRALQHDEPLVLEYGTRRYAAPTTVEQLDELLATDPKATLLAGGTDVGLWVTKQHRDLANVIYVGHVAQLHGFEENEAELSLGAALTHTQALPLLERCFPDFGQLLRRFGSLLIRNSSTVGGNIANGSPIGDSMPVMIALGARV